MEITDEAKKSIIKDEVKKTVVMPTKSETTKVNSDKKSTVKRSMDKGITIKISRVTPITEKDKHGHNLEVVLAHSNATPIRNFIGVTYTCIFCTAHFKYPADLKTHTLTTHDNTYERREFMRKQSSSSYLLKLDITLLKCKLCDESIDSLEGLFDHLQNEHKKLIYTDVKNQILPFKFGDDEFKCAICHRVLISYKVLLDHMRTHYTNYECDICGFGFFNRATMFNHKRMHRTGSFECSTCKKVFETQDKMKKHVNAIHRHKGMPAKCPVCNERFGNLRIKEKHVIAVHGRTPVIWKCLACEKIFPTQYALRIHTKRYHLLERNFKCTECEMKFFTKEQLKKHMPKHTGRKDFQCDICMKCFTRSYILKEHTRIHMNDRRYKCVLCGRGFVQKCSWRGHMRSVHGETDNSVLYDMKKS